MHTSATRAPRRPPVADRRDDDRPAHLRRVHRGRRRVATAVVAVVLVASVVVLLARAGQLESVAERLRHASTGLLLLAVAFEALSIAAYVVLTRLVFRPAAPRISWRESVEITLAGVVATRLLTAAGAGGIVLTTWTLRAAGLDPRSAAERLAAFLVILYSVFFGALLVDGILLATGALHGVPGGLALAGAAVAGLVIAVAVAALVIPDRFGRLPVSVARDAMAIALRIVRRGPSPLVAALAWWAFDIAVLWTTFEMFGGAPPVGVLVLCYFLGQVAQIIPLPGGVGPVEGGMIAAFAACGVPVALAILAVVSYQLISTWLPVVPGAWAYLRLRRTVAGWRES